MARPNATGLRRRVQVAAPEVNGPGLAVEAPLAVNTGASTKAAGWESLQRALGLAAPIIKDRQDKKNAEALEQGAADHALGQVDPDRKAHDERYADGVMRSYHTNMVAEAIREVDELAAAELPVDTPAAEAVAWADNQLKMRLGDLIEDPEARRIVASQYQGFIERFAGRKVEENRALHRETVASAWEVEVNRAIEGDDVDITQLVADGSAIFGEDEAWQRVTDLVASRAEALHDDGILRDLLPTAVETRDGTKHPMATKANRARIQLALERNAKWREEQQKPMFEWQQAQVFDHFEARIRSGDVLDMAEFEPLVTRGVVSAEKANEFVRRSHNEAEARREKRNEWADAMAAFQASGGESFIATEGLPGGAKSRGKAQELTDQLLSRELTGLMESNGQVPEGYDGGILPIHTGVELVKPENEQVLDYVLRRSKTLRLPYSPLRGIVDSVNPAMGETVLSRLHFYERAKEAGVSAMYFDDDHTTALFEMALTAKRANVPDDKIADQLRRTSTPEAQAHVARNREDAYKRLRSTEFDTLNRLFDDDLKDIGNLPMAQARLNALTDQFLAAGMSAKDAASRAQERYLETHYAVRLNGKSYALPVTDEYDPAEFATTLEWYAGAAGRVAAKHNDPKPDAARLVVGYGVGGRGIEVFYEGSDGNRIGNYLRPADLIRLMKEREPGYEELVSISRRSQETRRQRARRLYQQATTPLPSGPKY